MDQAKAKEDFDTAFAGFKASKVAPGASEPNMGSESKTRSAFDMEFPPISELEHDDESDSEDEKGGFEDDFAPASPNAKVIDKPGSPSLTKAVAGDAPPTGSEEGAAQKEEADDIFGSSPLPGSFPDDVKDETLNATAGAAPPASASKQSSSAFDELDDDFADLEDAKEGSQDDDFQTISRSGLDDFNPTFDSPPPAAKGEAAGAPPGSSSSNAPAFGTESTFDFASIDNTASQSSAAPAPEGSAAKPTENHDWDAIFASLDDAPPAQTSANPPPPGSPGSAAPPAASAMTTTEAPKERPDAPGRALTEEGTHDDPILKNLTSMGYSRADALNALEKYDYNLERVS